MGVLKGKITSGLGRGKFFLSLEGYKEQFKEKLGIKPIKGTLNVELDEESVAFYRWLAESNNCITLQPFKEGGKEYGHVKVFRAQIEDFPCYLVIPEKSNHQGVAELISQHHLRDELGLENGELVKITIAQNSSST
ncbi:MAG: DUF120 domain-containing protein [Thermoplasmata archaeon]